MEIWQILVFALWGGQLLMQLYHLIITRRALSAQLGAQIVSLRGRR